MNCAIKKKKRLGKQNIIPDKETISCLNGDFFDFYDYSDNRLDLIK
jgi:serine phosphatase RsbU (regulator of sigma subunit)